MPNVAWERDGWRVCLVRACLHCSGSGYCFVNAPFFDEFGNQASQGQKAPCQQCLRGMIFRQVSVDELINAVADATVARMTKGA